MTPSSETESRLRGRSALDRGRASRERGRPAPERGGVPLEGASDPRARRNLTRGGTDPRARRSCTGAAPYPSSGAEFRPRVAGSIV
jgi:hypothetical protein